ncbi:MAG TPA: hypothetical protein VHX86_20450 [Tepidisphaeraceae bacterium]|jgi:hypothetical protein|nr:hypothetical protein [Tepidisphaeraceae bacterium]
MLTFREVKLTQLNAVSSLDDQELRVAIAREIFGWRNIRAGADGRFTASHPTVLTTAPLEVPDWIGEESETVHLETVVRQQGWSLEFRNELNRIAGDFNPDPTGRQQCEAALMAGRNSRKGLLD